MALIHFFKEVLYTFYSPRFYSHLAHSAKGIGFRFILLYIIVSYAVISWIIIREYPLASNILDHAAYISNQLPTTTWKDGKLSIDKPSPFYIKDPNLGKGLTVIIDTNYKITDNAVLAKYMHDNKIMCIITEDKLVTLKHSVNKVLDIVGVNNALNIIDLKSQNTPVKDLIITHDDWKHYAKQLPSWIAIVIVSGYALYVFIYMIVVFFFALIIKILGWIMRADLNFDAAMRLSAAIYIPTKAISEILLLIGVPPMALISWPLNIGYMILSVWASKKSYDTLVV